MSMTAPAINSNTYFCKPPATPGQTAIAGRFVAAKDPLRAAALKLTDTLAVMPR